MDTSINFMINKDKVELLQNLKSRIESLFKVVITLGNEGPGTRWVNMSTPTGNAKTVQSAKDYVCSLCISDSKQQASKHPAETWPGEDCSACSRFEQNARDADEQPYLKCSSLERTKKLAELKAKLESEDSSYDSEGCEEDSQHEEVHRTVSDTLQAEYADFVDSRQQMIESSLGGSSQEDEQQLNDPYFTSKVEFGLKLGYTEKQVLQALKKLGPSPDENEFLGELIKVGANSKGVCLEPDTAKEIKDESSNLRHIVVDGSNVAKSHGNKEVFSCRGIQLAVDWFRKRGHTEITVFVPQWRKEASRPDAPITDQEILFQLEKENIVVFTPSRNICGRRTICYDDRYIIKLAAQVDGIVVSNDNYRDLINESPEYKKIIEERVLMYSFVNDRFMPPDDPLGRHGPSLDNFLLKEPVQPDLLARPCPYSKKCTYGNKCKFYHPERGNQPQKSVTEVLVENAMKIRSLRRDSSPAGEVLKTKLAATQSADAITTVKKQPLNRTKSLVTGHLPSSKAPGKEVIPASDTERVSSIPAKIAALNLVDSYNPPSLGATGGPWNGNTRRSSIPGGESAWSSLIVGAESLTTPHCLGFSSDHGGHLALAKRLSDPDNNKQTSEVLPPNPHQKLKRLTPTDSRLQQSWQGPSYSQPMNSLDLPESRNHRQLNRQFSYTDSQAYTMTGDEIIHPSLTRISSAPDSHKNIHRQKQGHMKRQNSSSDPQLNVHQEFLPELLTPDVFSYGEVDQNPWGTSHLMRHGFQRNLQSPSSWMPSSLSSHNHPIDTFFPPQPLQAPPPGAIGQRASPVASFEDPRFNLYYHLSSVFPEEQVRMVMNRHPEERNPQKICSAILQIYSRNYIQ